MKFTAFLLTLALCAGVSAQDFCTAQRFTLNNIDLHKNDKIQLNIGNHSIITKLKKGNFAGEKWPLVLGLAVRDSINASVASIGSLSDLETLGRYIPRAGNNVNVLDIFSASQASIWVNGKEREDLISSVELAANQINKSAYLPLWKVSSGDNSYIHITNLSDSDLPISIELVDVQGNTYTGPTDYSTGFSNNPTQTGGATLSAHSSAYLHVKAEKPARVGTGMIKWVAQSCQGSILVSIDQTTSKSTQIFRLNGGAPL